MRRPSLAKQRRLTLRPRVDHARDRMQVAGDFAVGAGRLVAEHERADRERGGRRSAQPGGRLGIVVAGDPDPVAPALERAQYRAVRVGEPRRAPAVVEAVAERDHGARRVAGEQAASRASVAAVS